MTATDPHRDPAGEEPGGPAPAPGPQPTLLDQMGGPTGFVHSAVPVVVFAALVVVWAWRRSSTRLLRRPDGPRPARMPWRGQVRVGRA
ncbi:hypothetical protein [Pseudonocardia sp.]|uniref:hypothetical protein n=1 Tax=Pseudonocardia sp. TaxID=60912 RepID=UPI003D125700